MTGQVKEEILTRQGELGLRVLDGEIVLDPRLLRRRELLPEPARWSCRGPGGSPMQVDVPAGGVGWTLYQVPVVLEVGDVPAIEIDYRDGRTERRSGPGLGAEASAAVFARRGEVTQIRATVSRSALTLD